MNNFYKLIFSFLLLFATNMVQAQLTGTRTIPSTNYPSVKIAVDSINLYGVGAGGIIYNITPGHYERTTGNIAVLINTSSSNSITFRKNGAGANPIITAGTGVYARDGILKISGTDSVTIDGLELRDTTSNTTANQMMEYGVVFFRKSVTDGSNNCKVKNCVIKLQKNNTTNGSFGIALLNADSSGSVLSPNINTGYRASNLLIDNDSISNVQTGIFLSNTGTPNSVIYDDNVIISNNNISNFGNSTNTYYGIRFDQCTGASVYNNAIIGGSGNTTTCYGIYNTGNDSMSNTIRKNTVSLSPSNTGSQIAQIAVLSYSGAQGTLNIDSNTIQNCTATSAAGADWLGIYINSSINFTTNIVGNTFSNNTYGSSSVTATGQFHAIYVSSGANTNSGSSITIAGNSISGHTRTQSTIGAGTSYMIGMTGEALSVIVNNNTIQNNNLPGTAICAGVYSTAASATVTRRIFNNTIKNITRSSASTGIKYGIGLTSGSSSIDSIYNNTISDWSVLGTGQFIGMQASSTGFKYYNADSIYNISDSSNTLCYGLYTTAGTSNSCSMKNNYIYNITYKLGTGTFYGINQTGSGTTGSSNTLNIDNNFISTLSHPNMTSGGLAGIVNSGMTNNNSISNNVIKYLTAGSSSVVANGLLYGINCTSSNTTSASIITIQNDSIYGFTRTQSTNGSGNNYMFYLQGECLSNVFANNIVKDHVLAGSGDFIILNNTPTAATTTRRCFNNKFSNNNRTFSSTGVMYGVYYIGASSSADSIYNNTITNYTTCGTGSFIGFQSNSTGFKYFNRDSVYNITDSSTGTNFMINSVGGTTNNVAISLNYIYNNTFKANTFTHTGIGNSSSSSTSGTARIDSNYISNQSFPNVTTGTVYGIQSTANAFNYYMRYNGIHNVTYGNGSTSASGTCYGIFNSGTNANASSFTTISNDSIDGFTRSQNTNSGGAFYNIFMSGAAITLNINNNLVQNSVSPGTGDFAGVYTTATTPTTRNIYNNIVKNFTRNNSSTGSTYGILISGGAATDNVYLNTVNSFNSIGTGTTYGYYFGGSATTNKFLYFDTVYNITTNGTIYGIYTLNGTNSFITRNQVSAITTNNNGVSAAVAGIVMASGTTANIFNNKIAGLSAPFSSNTTNALMGIFLSAGTNANVHYNTIYLNGSTAAANFGTAALYTNVSTILKASNNIFVNTSTPSGTGVTTAVYRAGTTVTTHNDSCNNNLLYAGTPSTTRTLVFDGTNRLQTLTTAKNYFRATATPFREQYSVSSAVSFYNSTNCQLSSFLKPDSSSTTELESGGRATSWTTDEFDQASVRTGYPLGGQVNSGGIGPDIGADEFDGMPITSHAYNTTVVTHPTLLATAVRQRNQQILKIDLQTTGGYNLKSITNLQFNANNTDNIADIDTAYIYYTGNTSTFDTLHKLAAIAPTLINYNISPSFKLQPGSNYFWLTYNIKSSATVTDTVDAELVDVTVGGSVQPINAAPDKGREIKGPMCGTYKVGTSSASDYATITDLTSELWTRRVDVACGTGVICKLIDATYSTGETFPIIFDSIEGTGPAGRTITLKPDSGVTATIIGSSDHSLIQFRGTRYFTVDGNNGNGQKSLIINNNNSAPTVGNIADVTLLSYGTNLGAKYMTFKNTQFTSFWGAPIGTLSTAAAGITTGTSALPVTTATDIDNLTIDSCWFYNVAQGCVLQGGTTMDTLTITHNIVGHDDYVTNRGAYGFFITNVGVTYFNYNRIYNLIGNASPAFVNPYGLLLQVTTVGLPVEIKKNNIYSIRYDRVTPSPFGAQGIWIIPNVANANVKIHNNSIADITAPGNIISAGQGNGTKGIAVTGTATSNVEIYNNSISMAGTVVRSGSTNDKTACIFIDNVADSIFMYNNTMSNSIQNSAGIDTAFSIYCIAASSKLRRIDNNNYYTSGTRSKLGFFLSAGTVNTIAAIKTATGQDTFSKTGDPKYNTSTNLRPQSTTNLYGAGKSLASITDDLLGTARTSTPTIGCYEDTGDFAAPVITYAAFVNSTNVNTYNINSNVKAIDPSPGTPATTCRVYYRKTTNANAWGGTNDNTTDGWKYVDGVVSGAYFNIPMDFTLINGGTTIGDVIQYFVIAQDGKAIPNVSYTKGTLTNAPTSITLTTEFPLTGTPDSFNINNAITGWFDVGPSYTYKNLTGDTGIFKMLNQNVLGSDIHVRIREDLIEPGTHALNEQSDSVGNSRIIIYPDGTTTRKITGYVPNAMIRINGADRVSIDGRDTATNTGKYLLFRNTNSTNPTIKFIGEPSYDTIEYCTIEGWNSTATSGTVYIGQGITDGVDNITITNNDFGNRSDSAAAALPYQHIYCEGQSIYILNDYNNITNNNIYNFTNAGVFSANIGNGNYWNISGNSFYYNHGTNPTTSQFAMNWAAGGLSGGNTFNDNYIGGSTTNCGGSYWTNANNVAATSFNGLRVTGSGLKSDMSGNVVKNIRVSSTGNGPQFIGILVNGSGSFNIGSIAKPNIIGDATDTSSINLSPSTSSHYALFSTSTNNVNMRYNKIQGMKFNSTTASVGMIMSQGATGFDSIEYNEIGSTAVNSINHYGTSTFFGINSTKTLGSLINGNTLKSISVFGTAVQVQGINQSATTGANIYMTGNTFGSSTATNGIRMYGDGSGAWFGLIASTTTATAYISNNTVKGIQILHPSNTGQIACAQLTGSCIYRCNNNTFGELGINNSMIFAGNTSQLFGLYLGNSDSTFCYGNTLAGINLTNTGGTGAFYGMYHPTTNTYFLDSGNMVGDPTVTGSITNASSGTMYGIYNVGASTNGITFKNNTIGGISRTNTGSYTTYIVNNSNGSNTASGHKFSNNTIQNLSFAGTATTYGMYLFGSATPSLGLRVNDNIIKDIAFTHPSGSCSFFGIAPVSGAPDFVCYNNTIGDAASTNNITMNEASTFGGIYNTNATDTVMVYNNTIAGVNINNSSSSPTMYCIYNSTATNYFLDSANTTGNPSVNGSITIAGTGTFAAHNFAGASTSGIYIRNNTIGGITRSGTGTYTSYGIFNSDASNTKSAHHINNNTIQNMTFAGLATTYGINSTTNTAVDNNGGPGNRNYNNIIKTISFTHSSSASTFYPLYNAGAGDWLVYNNIIGDTSATSDISMKEVSANGFGAIYNNSGTDTVIVYGNVVGGITINNSSTSPNMYGFTYVPATSYPNYLVDSANIIGNANVSGSITINGNGTFYGHNFPTNISVTGTRGVNIRNNRIGGITRTSTGSANTYGIYDAWAPTGLQSPHNINDNSISNWNMSNVGITTGIFCNISSSRNNFVYNNTIKGFTFTNTGTGGSFAGIAINAGKVLLTQPDSSSAGNNVIGDPNVSNNINSSMNGPHNGISTGSANAISVIGNSVNNITATSTGTSCVVIGIACGNSATATIINSNTVKNLSGAGTTTNGFNLGGAVCGIYTTSTSTMSVNNNIVNGIALTSTGTTSNAYGIDLYLSGNTTVNSNRVYNMSSTSNGNLTGLYFNSTNASTHAIKNNQLSIANGANTNDLPIQGIYADNGAGSGTVQMYYNTVFLSGSASSGSNISASYFRNSTTGTTNVLNNIFMNSRTGGSANHVAQAYIGGITNNRTNYNLNITADSNRAVSVSGTNWNINAWRNGLKRDSSGWYAIAGTNVVADSMFIDKANGNLGINTTTTDAWYANGKGLQTPGYADEYGNTASVRSTTVANGAPDLGSDEFTPTSHPDELFSKGPHTNGNVDSLMYGFRPVAYVKWRGASIPTFTTIRYYTGTTPPDNTNNGNNPSARYLNCYWWISATGGTAEYDINFIYDDALVGSISSESSLRITRKEVGVVGSWKAHTADATVNTTTNNMQLLNTRGFSIWTGSDNASPLPVTLVSFTGQKQDKNVMLKWVSSFEEQMDGYEVEFSADAQNFNSIGFVKAVNNRFSENNYNLLHTSPVKGNNYYRLKSIESNGKFTYSNIVVVNFDEIDRMQIVIQPNPSKDQVSVILQNQTQPALIQVYDMAGRLMFNEKVSLGQSATQVNLSGWNLGSYILRVTNDDGTSFINRIMKIEE